MTHLTPESLARLSDEGFAPAAVIETSPGNFQAWLKHTQPLPKELSTQAAKRLAERFGADKGAADWRRFGRMPGFTNRKPKHQNALGLYPFARLVACSGDLFLQAEAFCAEVIASFERQAAEQREFRSRYALRPFSSSAPLTLAQFRNAPKYTGQPAAATWPLLLRPTPVTGPIRTSQQSLPRTISPATQAGNEETCTSDGHSPKPCNGSAKAEPLRHVIRVPSPRRCSYAGSNGMVEGQLHRLKLIKRQLYGRADFDLLRPSFLRSAYP